MSRIRKIVLLCLAGLLLTGVLVWGSGYLWSLRRQTGLTEKIPGVLTWEPQASAPLGGDLRAVLEFDLPLWCRVLQFSAEPGKGMTAAGPVTYQTRWRWDHARWRISVPLRGYRMGTIPPGEAVLELSPAKRGGAPVTHKAVLPDCRITDAGVPAGHDLALANPVSVPASFWHRARFHLLAGGVILLAGALAALWFFRRKRRAERPVTPWEAAQLALHTLRQDLTAGRVAPLQGYDFLTDLVRKYLEARFRIPAPRRTTPEFLADLDRSDSPLAEEHRPFLREFLNSADLVRFAKVPPDPPALVRAIDRAGELVEHTRPEDPAAPKEEKNV